MCGSSFVAGGVLVLSPDPRLLESALEIRVRRLPRTLSKDQRERFHAVVRVWGGCGGGGPTGAQAGRAQRDRGRGQRLARVARAIEPKGRESNGCFMRQP
jgi:hypothetical protein